MAGQSSWDMLWIKHHCDSFPPEYFRFNLGILFQSRPITYLSLITYALLSYQLTTSLNNILKINNIGIEFSAECFFY
jgi:hypothetical protein